MPQQHQIKQTVRFPEQTTVPEEQSGNPLSDIIKSLTI